MNGLLYSDQSPADRKWTMLSLKCCISHLHLLSQEYSCGWSSSSFKRNRPHRIRNHRLHSQEWSCHNFILCWYVKMDHEGGEWGRVSCRCSPPMDVTWLAKYSGTPLFGQLWITNYSSLASQMMAMGLRCIFGLFEISDQARSNNIRCG